MLNKYLSYPKEEISQFFCNEIYKKLRLTPAFEVDNNIAKLKEELFTRRIMILSEGQLKEHNSFSPISYYGIDAQSVLKNALATKKTNETNESNNN